MSVRSKLLVIIGFVALVPLSVLAYTILDVHRDAFEAKLAELHMRSAKYGAKIVEADLEGAVRGLRPLIVDSIRWPDLTVPEREGALWLVYGQLASIVSVELVEASGQPLGEPARLEGDADQAKSRVQISAHDVAQLRAALKLHDAPEGEAMHAEPILLSDSKVFALPVAFRVPGATTPWVVVVGLALTRVCEELTRERLAGSRVSLLSAAGNDLCVEPSQAAQASLDAELRDQLQRGAHGSIRYRTRSGRDVLAAAASTPWSFRVVVAQPASEAFAASTRMQRESLVWIAVGLLAALGAGLVLARAINEPLLRLQQGAGRVASGDFAVRLPAEGSDELAQLSTSFNHMCSEIEKRQLQISGWNDELRARVEEKAAELKHTQDALLESRKIAAMTALGAGVAHEINNPLTGVIGLTQVLIGRLRKQPAASPEVDLLLSVEREALRVRDIVQRMLKLSQTHESAELSEVRPNELVRNVINSRRAALVQAGIGVEEAFAADVPAVLGHREELSQVFEELIDNAMRAMRPKPGKLSVSVEALDGEVVRMRVSDTGKGIAPEHLDKVFEPFFTTKDDWQGQGLGLTAAYRVIEAHRGTIKLDSKPGRGTTVIIALPAKRGGAHLA